MPGDIHKCKIDMDDEIYVINSGGYIGSNTKNEIEYTKATGKMVRYLVEIEEIKKVCAIPRDRRNYHAYPYAWQQFHIRK